MRISVAYDQGQAVDLSCICHASAVVDMSHWAQAREANLRLLRDYNVSQLA